MQQAFSPSMCSGLAEQVRADLVLCKGWSQAAVQGHGTTGEALVRGQLAEGGAQRVVLPVPSAGSATPEAMVKSLQDKPEHATTVAFVDSDGAVSYFAMQQVDLRAPPTPNFFA